MYFLPTCVVLCCRGVAALVARTILVIRSFREVSFTLQRERVHVTDSRGSSWTWCVCAESGEVCTPRVCGHTHGRGTHRGAHTHTAHACFVTTSFEWGMCVHTAGVRPSGIPLMIMTTSQQQPQSKRNYNRELRVSVSSAFGRSLGAKSSTSAVAFLTRASLSPVARLLGSFCTWALAAASSAGSAPKGVVRRR